MLRGTQRDRYLQIIPYVPWGQNSPVAVDVDESKAPADLKQHPAGRHGLFEGGLERILSFSPLLQAFEDFCLKALCIEVRQPCFWSSCGVFPLAQRFRLDCPGRDPTPICEHRAEETLDCCGDDCFASFACSVEPVLSVVRSLLGEPTTQLIRDDHCTRPPGDELRNRTLLLPVEIGVHHTKLDCQAVIPKTKRHSKAVHSAPCRPCIRTCFCRAHPRDYLKNFPDDHTPCGGT